MTIAGTISQEVLASRWARLGVLFNVVPAQGPINLEELLVDSVGGFPENTRLFIGVGTWISVHGQDVIDQRLADRITSELPSIRTAPLGLLLEQAMAANPRLSGQFSKCLALCRPADPPGPLSNVSRRNPVLWELARANATDASRRWGCWTDAIIPQPGILRPRTWVERHWRGDAFHG